MNTTLIKHKTAVANQLKQDNRAFADFVQKGEIGPKIRLIIFLFFKFKLIAALLNCKYTQKTRQSEVYLIRAAVCVQE